MVTIKDLLKCKETGSIINTPIGKARVVSGILRVGKMDAIYLDVIDAEVSKCMAIVKKIDDNTACIVRNKEKMLEMGLTTKERNAIYCHELGHCFSEKQQSSTSKERTIEDEIDSDTFAVEKCGVELGVLASSLKKTMEYNLNNAPSDITQERIEKFITEFNLRLNNVKILTEKLNKIYDER